MLRPLDRTSPATQTATFSLGCFSGPDAQFGCHPAIVRTRVGYAGGSTIDPTYHDLADHTEVFQVDFDHEKLSYEELLRQIWANRRGGSRAIHDAPGCGSRPGRWSGHVRA